MKEEDGFDVIENICKWMVKLALSFVILCVFWDIIELKEQSTKNADILHRIELKLDTTTQIIRK